MASNFPTDVRVASQIYVLQHIFILSASASQCKCKHHTLSASASVSHIISASAMFAIQSVTKVRLQWCSVFTYPRAKLPTRHRTN